MRRSHSGLTIFELLLAIAVLIGISAIAIPNVAERLNDRAFESAADMTVNTLMFARAHAQTTGRAVEVRLESRGDQTMLFSRYFTPGDRAIDDGEFRQAQREDSATDDALDMELAEEDPITESWALRDLSAPLQTSIDPPEQYQSDVFEPALRPEQPEQTDRRLAVFLPDGSTLLAERERWLYDDQVRAGVLSINPWSGHARFERRNPVDDSVAAEEEESDVFDELDDVENEKDAAPPADPPDDSESDEEEETP